MDENEFFREATLRICGNLEIEEGLRSCVEYLSRHMPADVLYLESHVEDLDALWVVAQATKKMGEKMDVLIPLPEEARAAMGNLRKTWQTGTLPPNGPAGVVQP